MGCGGGFSPNNSGSGGGGSTGVTRSWGFDFPADYTFNSSQVEVAGSAAKIKRVNYTVDTQTEFDTGTYVGTNYTGGFLSLVPASATNELNAAATPKFADLVAYWKFEGDFVDSSVETNNGTVMGDAANDTVSFKVGSESLVLDGAGDYVVVADDDSLDADLSTNMTLALWIKHNADGVTDRVITKECSDGGVTESSYFISINPTGVLSFSLSINGTSFSSVTTTSARKVGQWTHVVGNYDGAEMKIFMNGKLEATTARTGTIFNGTTDLLIGGRRTGGGCSSAGVLFEGNIDDVAIWKATLTDDEISMVYNQQKQKYFGFFDSEILNSGTPSSPWPTIEWTASLPLLKELTGDVNNDGIADSESSTVNYYMDLVGSSGSTSDNNLMNSLVLLYRFNGAADYTGVADEVTDYARNTVLLDNSGVAVGGNISPADGMFNQGRLFDGSGKSISVTSFNTNPDFTEDKAFSFWLKLDPEQADVTGTTNTILIDGDGTRNLKVGVHNQTALAPDIGKLFVEATDGASTPVATSSKLINDGEFHHILISQKGGNLRIFIDGDLDGSVINSTTGSYGGAYTFNISAASEGFSGVMDELAYWARGLHYNIGASNSMEAKQLYYRGTNRVKSLIKTCIDAACNCRDFGPGGNTTDCDGDTILNTVDDDDTFFANWLGPDGTGSTAFSELHNNTSINASGEADGEVNRVSASLTFADFAGAGLSVPDNQYVQFRTILESNEQSTFCAMGPCLPKVNSVSLGSTNFFGGVIEINNTVGFTYTSQIKSVTLDEVGGANCSFNYQVSNNNGITWYYNNAGTWTVATLAAHVTSSADLITHIPTFHSQVGTGLFKFKLFMQSLDLTTNCNLNRFDINF